MADIAYNPETGKALRLQDNQWVPTDTAENPETKERLVFDGQSWESLKNKTSEPQENATPKQETITPINNVAEKSFQTEGSTAYNPETGESLRLQDNQWVPTAEGPQPTDAAFTMDSLDTNKAWLDSAKKIYQSEKGALPIEMQRDPAKLAQWLKERHSEIGNSLLNVKGKGIVETALTTFDMKDDAKKAWIKSIDMYENTDSDWGSRARAARQFASDPTTVGSLIYGFGIGGLAKIAAQKGLSKVAISAFRKELVKSLAEAGYKQGAINRAVAEGVSRAIPAEVLKTHAKSAATKAAVKKVGKASATGAGYTAAFDAAQQQFGMNIDDDKDFSYGQFALMTAAGAGFGAGLSGVGKGISKLRGKQSELAKFEDDIVKQADTEAAFRKEALPVGPTATRAVDFKETGNYDVVLSDGSKVQIFRDTEQFSYPVWHRVGENNPYTVGIGSTKKEALESLEDSLPKKSSPAKSAAKRQKKLEAEEEAAFRDLDGSGPNVDSRGKIIETIGNANTFLGRLLRSDGALAKPLADAGVARENINALQLQGKRLFKAFQKEYKTLSQAQKDKVNNYLSTGEGADEFSVGFQKASHRVRRYITSNERVFNAAAGLKGKSKLGFGHKDGEVYFTTFYTAENNPAYLKQIMNAVAGKKATWSTLTSNQIKERVENMRVFLIENGITDIGSQNETIVAMVKSLAKSDGDLFTDATVRLSASVGKDSPIKALLKKKDLDPRIKRLLGEVDDPLKKIQKTFDTQQRLVGQAQYLAAVDRYAREVMAKDGLVVMGGLIPKLPTRIERIKKITLVKTKVDVVDAEGKQVLYKSGPRKGDVKQKTTYNRPNEELDKFVRQNIGSRANNARVLQGMWMSDNMAEYIRNGVNLFDSGKQANKFMAPVQNLAALGQASQTIFDIPAYALNTVGAITMTAANGHILNPFAYKAARAAVKTTIEQIKLNNPKAIAKLEMLKRAGLIDSDLSAEMIVRNVNQSLTNPKNILTIGYRKGIEKAGKAYGSPDTYAKLLSFESELNSIRKMKFKNKDNTDFTIDQLNKLAIDRVRATIPTYNAAAPLARQLSRLPIGTYALFPSEIVRTSKNIIKLGVSDVRDGIKNKNAAQIRAGLNRLAAFGAVTAGTEAMINSSNDSLGIDKDTAYGLEQVMAPWYKNTIRQHNTALIENKDGEIITNFRNSSQYDAYDFVKQPIRVIIGSLLGGKELTDTEVEDSLSGLAGAAIGPYTNPKFLTQALLTIVGGQGTDRGGIYSTAVGERGFSSVNVKKAVIELAESLEPGTSQIIRQYLTSLSAEKWAEAEEEAAVTNKGFPLEVNDIRWHMGTGIKPQTMNVNKSIGYTLATDVKNIKNTGVEFLNYLKGLDREVYSPERRQEILDKFRYYQDLKFKGMQDLAGKIDRIKQIKYNDSKGEIGKTIDDNKLALIVTDKGWYPFADEIIYANYAGSPIDLIDNVKSKEGFFMPDNPDIINLVIKDNALPDSLIKDLHNVRAEYFIPLRPKN